MKIFPFLQKQYTANWSEHIYSIGYNYNEGELQQGLSNPTNYSINTETFALEKPTREGYSFVGWSGTDIDGIASEASIIKGYTGNRQYTANWSINSYNLELIAGENVLTTSGAGAYKFGENVTASCTFENGYEFASWSGDMNTGNFVMPGNDVSMTANSKPVVYKINYNLVYGLVEEANPTNYDITSSTITLNPPIKEGFEFIG